MYASIYENVAPWHLDARNPVVWFAYWLVGDFAYYWVHRAEHEYPVLWASHVVHHSAEDFGFTTAVRMPPTEIVYKAVTGLWAPLLGFPPALYAAMTASGLIAGQLQHSRMVGRMGWFDRWFATPSNHRVHHGSNPRYLDKNFGGRTMVWDRMFGTYEPETEPVRYGATEALESDGVWGTILGGYPRLVREWQLSRPT
jgi:sterol desaturase/sphingolipid hydroxylase (fatty acid hydroxylase superfamily)